MSGAVIEIEHRDRTTHGDYIAHVPDHQATAKLSWAQRGEVRHAEHTFVPPEFRGKGVAAKLVEALVGDAREQGFKISPDCSYVEAAFRKHPEWDGLRA